MRKALSLFMFLVAAAIAQTISPNVIRVIPTPAGTPGGSTTGIVEMEATDATHYVGLRAPATLSTNTVWTMPPADATGCLQSNGSGVLSFGSCGGALTPPVTLSGSSALPILTLTQSGAGYALNVNGPAAVSYTAAVAAHYGSNSGSGPGVSGVAFSTGNGVQGASSSTGAGVYASNSSTGSALYAINSSSGPAGTFSGPVGFSGGNVTFGSLTTIYTSGNIGISSTVNSVGEAIQATNNGAGNAGTFSSAGSGATVFSQNTSSGNGGNFLANSGTGIYATSTSGLAAEFGSGVKFDGQLTGTHAQNVGTGDYPTFAGLTTGSILSTGTLSGTHLQNVGSGDNVTFNAITSSSYVDATSVSTSLLTVGLYFTASTSGITIGGNTAVACSGTPTSSFTTVAGIVTHC